MAKKGRRRVSKDDVRKNAKEGGRGAGLFKLPKNVRSWYPDKPQKILLDFLPYETTDANHPDNREVGDLWYKRPFRVHRGVGVRNESVVCPVSIGKKCPICQEREKLQKKDKDKYAKAIKDLYPQKWSAYNIIDPEDKKKVAVFATSIGKFANTLEKELEEGDEDILLFFDVTEDGKTLKVRFSEESKPGFNKWIEATRIDFIDRDEMDEDKMLKRVVNLDEILNIVPYDKLKSLFLQIDEDEKEEDEEPEEDDEPEEKDDEPAEDPEPDEKPEDDPEPEEKEEEPEEKPEPKKDKDKKKGKGKGKGKSKDKCPVEGGVYGKHTDKYDECDDCPHWNACEDGTK